MSVMKCPKCGNAPCICRPWCPEQRQCLCSQHVETTCAGPLVATGQDNIGDRPCCGGLKKCSDKDGFRQWCSNTGKCPGDGATMEYPVQPFKKYYDFFVKEKFTSGRVKSGQGIL